MKIQTLLVLLSLFPFLSGNRLLAEEIEKARPMQRGGDLHSYRPADEIEGPRLSEDGETELLSPLADLPVIDPSLAGKMAIMEPGALIRVIVSLKYHPHDLISREARDNHALEREAIEQEIAAVNGKYAQRRKGRSAGRDSDRFEEADLILSPEDRAALRVLSERNEALSLILKREMTARLRAELEPGQRRVGAAVLSLGGRVEFGLVCVNALVVTIPAAAIEPLSSHEDVFRIFEDGIMQPFLDNADDATLVSATGGPWENGATGGVYDPAVVDTGTDIDHPALADSSGRTNFYTWFLEAGSQDPEWNDTLSEDDWQGHGSHVIGIVASYGTNDHPDHRGMGYGVERAVTLKAAYRTLSGGGRFAYSDTMGAIDRALYHTNDLIPLNSFHDDVDGVNMSSGIGSVDDDNDLSRFWDSIVSSYSDLIATLAAGNSGPDNDLFMTPACAYNSFAVANVYDRGTPQRSDDVIANNSTRGPTANGRRKPDLGAPGSGISSCNHKWELDDDFVSASGTSLSAPMVLGVAMDLMDAGVIDEVAIKALLLNTAQKNCGTIDFEDDEDGWDEAYGWGYINAASAYYHRTDVIIDTVTARPNSGYYHLYKGAMQDEGSTGEGRDRVTMAWNRHATYNPAAPPTTYYDLSDLNLRLYRESDAYLYDADLSGIDNVHQVRIDSGEPLTDVVVKAYAWDTSFPHGGSTETFSLATEENFTEVPLPADFSAMAYIPAEVEPLEAFYFTFFLFNDSEIASHVNKFDIELPAYWSLVEGDDPHSAGSIPGQGVDPASATWTLASQQWEEDNVRIYVYHDHDSYGETWGPESWYVTVDVRYDNEPPSPDPMTWETPPWGHDTETIRMEATTATDVHEPVEYHFLFYGSPTGGSGGYSSDWQTNTDFKNLPLEANHQYEYMVQARDSAHYQNQTYYSSIEAAYTLAHPPGSPAVENPATTEIDVAIDSNGNPAWTEFALYVEEAAGGAGYFLNTTGGYNGPTPSWATAAAWGTVTARGLNPGTEYGFRAMARNGDGIETTWSSWAYETTLRNPCVLQIMPDPLLGGFSAIMSISGGEPSADTYLAYSTAGPGSTYIPTMDVYLGISDPKLLAGPAKTNADGIVTWILSIPYSPGLQVWIQGLQYGAATNVIATSIE